MMDVRELLIFIALLLKIELFNFRGLCINDFGFSGAESGRGNVFV